MVLAAIAVAVVAVAFGCHLALRAPVVQSGGDPAHEGAAPQSRDDGGSAAGASDGARPSGGADAGAQAHDAKDGAAGGTVKTDEGGAGMGEPTNGQLPVDVPDTWVRGSASNSGTCDVWRFTSNQTAAQAAQQLIERLGAVQGTMRESGYLDIGSSAWGCCFEMPGASCSLVVTMIPATIGQEAGADNPLQIKIIRYNAADVAELA